MIKIVAKNVVKENCIDDFIDLAHRLIEESRKEDGCKEYHLYQDINNPLVLTFIEEWEDEEAIVVHNDSKHFMRIVPKLRELESAPAEVIQYKKVK